MIELNKEGYNKGGILNKENYNIKFCVENNLL